MEKESGEKGRVVRERTRMEIVERLQILARAPELAARGSKVLVTWLLCSGHCGGDFAG